ncbi:MAG: glycosyltransferase [Paracoccaceae bacterium]
MVKAPAAGRSKTRLGREIGMVPAAWWARHQLAHLARTLRDPRWDIMLAVAPDTAVASGALPALPRLAQGPGDLGDRMVRVFRALPGPTLIVGADIPGITQAHIAAGFAALGSHDAVLGPAPDGGYWAIGLRHTRPLPPRLFDGVRWSSPHALADTLATLDGRRAAFLVPLLDVDTAADLKRVSH